MSFLGIWMGINKSSNDIVSSDDEWEEYDYGNPPDTTTDSFFEPYMKTREKNNIEKDDERSQTRHKYNNTSNFNDEQPNKMVCKAKKFEAIKYSLGPNEEYIAVRRCEYNTWERNEDNTVMSDYEDFTVTYTAVSSQFGGLSDIGSQELLDLSMRDCPGC
ncbi:hypothetical protein Tco_0528659 [Tanacetum coccineum]